MLSGGDRILICFFNQMYPNSSALNSKTYQQPNRRSCTKDKRSHSSKSERLYAYSCHILQSSKEVIHINSVKTVMCESDATLTPLPPSKETLKA